MRKAFLIVLGALLLFGCVSQPQAQQATATPGAGATAAPAIVSPTPSPVSTEAVVRFYGYAVNPREVTVKVGGRVTWVNDEQHLHGVDFGEFGSDVLGPGATYTETFYEAGDYNYSCGVHDYPAERGVVHVVP